MEKKFDYIRDGLLGLIVGDAIGVPAEFKSRTLMKAKPVKEMMGYGTHNQPCGTWSDDSSMTLCTLDSLCKGYDPDDIMKKFSAWIFDAAYTPWGKVFDFGRATSSALHRYKQGRKVRYCGGREHYDNGNGSLMRILPMVYYQFAKYNGFKTNNRQELIDPIHEVSALTHAHPTSMIGCGIYAQLIAELIWLKNGEGDSLAAVLQEAMDSAWNDYEGNGYGNLYHDDDYLDSLICYSRLKDITAFASLPEDHIKSSGYVVYTLEAALWCFLNTDNYRDCVLKAVNLGDDTDTVAAVAGSFAGIYYGAESIPADWLESLARLNWIEKLIVKFTESL